MKDSLQIHLHSPIVARILRIRARIRGRDASQTTLSLEQATLQYTQELEDFKHSLQIEMTMMAASESWNRQRMGEGGDDDDDDGEEKWNQWDRWNERPSRWMPKDFSGEGPEAI
jgi:hypothetical protein